MAIKFINQKVDRETLQVVGFEIGPAEWVQATIGDQIEETNRYEAICKGNTHDRLSVVFYFDEDSTTLLGVDEVVLDEEDDSIKYNLESTPAWHMLHWALMLYLHDMGSKFQPVPVRNLAELKRSLHVGALFEIREHQKVDHCKQIREVKSTQTNAVWTVIYGQPDHEVSTANHGKGYWTPFGKASHYDFGETIKWFNGNANKSKLIMEFVVLSRVNNHNGSQNKPKIEISISDETLEVEKPGYNLNVYDPAINERLEDLCKNGNTIMQIVREVAELRKTYDISLLNLHKIPLDETPASAINLA